MSAAKGENTRGNALKKQIKQDIRDAKKQKENLK
jgi:hypothetical protein